MVETDDVPPTGQMAAVGSNVYKPAHMVGNCGYLVSWSETDTEPFSSMVERSHVTTKDAGSTPVMVPNEKKACSQKIQ